ncbi:MAG: hypothetical protein PHP05_02585 [Sideroxydans sp.]|uniref:hypothetical protein n=1 Tax=Acidithiobacillus ferrooxidans TaxID=920 RepID=UPI000A6B4C18|nr:hypothetical protein [Acidithiobacillus ferrooxidans]MDD5470790.1 hypothetical protein [Sideroxydans sp.]
MTKYNQLELFDFSRKFSSLFALLTLASSSVAFADSVSGDLNPEAPPPAEKEIGKQAITQNELANRRQRVAREDLKHEAIPAGMEPISQAAPALPAPKSNFGAQGIKNISRDNALSTLAAALASSPKEGSQTRSVLMAAARRGDLLPAISWSLSRRYWGLATLLVENNPDKIPHWVLLSLALHKQDLPAMQAQLKHPSDLPSRDLVQAEEALGHYHQAQALAIQSLQANPFDRDLRQMYMDSLRHTASYVGINGVWQSFNGLQLYGPQVSATIRFTPFWGIHINSENLWQESDDAAQLTFTPHFRNRTDMGFFWQGRRWQWDSSVGEYRGLRNNWTAKLSMNWQMTDSTNISSRFAYHSQTFQSPALAVAGMANRAAIQLAQTVDAWTANAALGWNQYLGQDGVQLGTDSYGELSAFWRSTLGPWTFHVGPFADYHALQRRNEATGLIAAVLAPDARNIDSILPGSYADYGLRLQWGVKDQELYAGWMPNLELSVYDNSRFGFQYQLNAGISTAVLGPDRLSLNLAQGQGGNGLALNQQIVDLNYRFYF